MTTHKGEDQPKWYTLRQNIEIARNNVRLHAIKSQAIAMFNLLDELKGYFADHADADEGYLTEIHAIMRAIKDAQE